MKASYRSPRIRVWRFPIYIGIAQQTFAVGADIQHHRDHARRIDSACGRVDGQFADRYFNAADTPIADSQDLFGVRSENQIDIVGTGAKIGKGLLNRFGMIDR